MSRLGSWSPLAALAIVMLIAGSVSAQSIPFPTPEDITIKKVVAGGSGCPKDTTSVRVTATEEGGPADFFEINYSAYQAAAGKNIAKSNKRKFCTVAVQLYVPQGFRFALTRVHYEGYALVPKGGEASLTTSYHFPFFSDRVETTRTVTGPFDDSYKAKDTLGLLTGVWSACGSQIPLNVKSVLKVSAPDDKYAAITVDQMTGKMKQKWAIQWQKCTTSTPTPPPVKPVATPIEPIWIQN